MKALSPQHKRALQTLAEGITDLLTGQCTVQGSIAEDVARMIERCQDGEELRDLSVQIRDLMFRFRPDASRVAMTTDEAHLLHLIESAASEPADYVEPPTTLAATVW